MILARTSKLLLLLGLSIFTTAAPTLVFGSPGRPPITPCELFLLRGERQPIVDPRPSRRMVDATTRERHMSEMNAPSAIERDQILFKATPVERGSATTPFVRATISYILTRTDWTPFQKAIFWEVMALEIANFPGIVFQSDYSECVDGSFAFSGGFGETIVFRPDGKILRGSDFPPGPGRKWDIDYGGFKILNP